jgi:2'-5' RNA ligase
MLSYLGFKVPYMGFDAHMTVLYIGDTEEEQADEIRKFLEEAQLPTFSATAQRDSIKLFGPNEDIPVLTLIVPEAVRDIRTLLEDKFDNASEFKDWNPHVTLDFECPGVIQIPPMLSLIEFGLY